MELQKNNIVDNFMNYPLISCMTKNFKEKIA